VIASITFTASSPDVRSITKSTIFAIPKLAVLPRFKIPRRDIITEALRYPNITKAITLRLIASPVFLQYIA
jgi:hypothetical protein